jgi:hypothetical protein
MTRAGDLFDPVYSRCVTSCAKPSERTHLSFARRCFLNGPRSPAARTKDRHRPNFCLFVFQVPKAERSNVTILA